MMITFTLQLPPLTEEQQFQLEEALLKVPRVDAFGVEPESGFFVVTTAKETLHDMAATLYSWASNYTGMLLLTAVACNDRAPMILGKHSPNDVIHYLASCS